MCVNVKGLGQKTAYKGGSKTEKRLAGGEETETAACGKTEKIETGRGNFEGEKTSGRIVSQKEKQS